MCVDRRVVGRLNEVGHDAVHSGDLGLMTASDSAVMERALEDRRIVVTHDSDFAQLLARSGARAPSVLRVRMPTAAYTEVAAAVMSALEAAATDLELGAIVSVSERGARIRRLPVQTADNAEQSGPDTPK